MKNVSPTRKVAALAAAIVLAAIGLSVTTTPANADNGYQPVTVEEFRSETLVKYRDLSCDNTRIMLGIHRAECHLNQTTEPAARQSFFDGKNITVNSIMFPPTTTPMERSEILQQLNEEAWELLKQRGHACGAFKGETPVETPNSKVGCQINRGGTPNNQGGTVLGGQGTNFSSSFFGSS